MLFTYRAFWLPFQTCEVQIQHFNLNDHIYKTICHSRSFYEQDLLFFLAYHIPKGGIYIDIGANIGNHSLFFALFKADHVISVEPSSTHLSCLRKNIEINAITNISVCPVALSSYSGLGYLYLEPNQADNSGMTQVVTHQTGSLDSVSIQTLDSLIESTSYSYPFTLLKIDAEGMDYDVLLGAEHTLNKYQPVVVFEAISDDDFDRINRYLTSFGYYKVEQFGLPATYVYQSSNNRIIQGKLFYTLFNIFRRIHRKWGHYRLNR